MEKEKKLCKKFFHKDLKSYQKCDKIKTHLWHQIKGGEEN